VYFKDRVDFWLISAILSVSFALFREILLWGISNGAWNILTAVDVRVKDVSGSFFSTP